MENFLENKNALLDYANNLHARVLLSRSIGEDYYEPGMMEYLDKSEGIYDSSKNVLYLKVELKGTRYEGRTQRLETKCAGERVVIKREADNTYNPNNFTVTDKKNLSLGNLPAPLCNAMASLYDNGYAKIGNSRISFVDPITNRSKHAKQGVVFIEFEIIFKGI